MNALDTTLHFHERTKHAFERYARSLGYMDWDNQPDPFRRFADAPLVQLALGTGERSTSYDDLYSAGKAPPEPANLDSLSAFFELSLAISAWKETQGSRWALRINPSSGNLHPTECYLIAGPVPGLHDLPAVYHYAPKEHALERRAEFSHDTWQQLAEGFRASPFFIGLSSIHWREAWKYGERAYRYCQHDIGHAVAAIAMSAAIQGWQVRWLDEMSDDQVAGLLGLDRPEDFEDVEPEHPDLLLAVMPAQHDVGENATSQAVDINARGVSASVVTAIAKGNWCGSANPLSANHVEWDIIDAVAAACAKPMTEALTTQATEAMLGSPLDPDRPPVPAETIIRQRRSAVAMDGRTGISAEQFFLMLDRLMPRPDRPPWQALGPPACVHLGLFVHLVDGLDPGLYCLVRSPDRLDEIRSAMDPAFEWQQPPDCPESLPLFVLQRGDARKAAWKLSCDQQIAGASAFSLGMIAEFEPRLREHGPWFYRRLFWETGMIGQILYLEAEAAGIRGTGIGCYFDDPVREIFGLSVNAFQSLYHFTVGGPVGDTRLTTLPPYPDR